MPTSNRVDGVKNRSHAANGHGPASDNGYPDRRDFGDDPGTSFTGATVVDFGLNAATGLTVVNDTTITADSPAGAVGNVDVTVITPAGTSPTSVADQYTYTAAVAPTVTALAPTSGPAAGGTLVTISGTSFTGATAVDFGATPATGVIVVNDTTITADSPAGTGVVNVTVVTPSGTSPTSPADDFTYIANQAPAIAGAVGVTVTTPSGTSPVSAVGQFTFAVAPPTVVSLVRFGFHMQQTTLVLTFSSALDAATAQNVNNYQIVTTDGQVIPVGSAVFDPATLTVTLTPTQLLSLTSFYQLTVNGTTPSGLTGATGVPLDGLGNGIPGSNFVTTFGGGILVAASPALQTTQPNRFVAEQNLFAAEKKSWAPAPKRSAAKLHKSLAVARKKMATAQKRLATQLHVAKAASASGVDALSAQGKSTAKSKAVRIHVGHNHPRG